MKSQNHHAAFYLCASILLFALVLAATTTPASATCEHGACPWGVEQCNHLSGRFQEGDKTFDKFPYCDENNCCQYIVRELIICESGYEIGYRDSGVKRARECTPGEFDEAGIFHITKDVQKMSIEKGENNLGE